MVGQAWAARGQHCAHRCRWGPSHMASCGRARHFACRTAACECVQADMASFGRRGVSGRTIASPGAHRLGLVQHAALGVARGCVRKEQAGHEDDHPRHRCRVPHSYCLHAVSAGTAPNSSSPAMRMTTLAPLGGPTHSSVQAFPSCKAWHRTAAGQPWQSCSGPAHFQHWHPVFAQSLHRTAASLP